MYINGVIVSVFALSVVESDHGFKPKTIKLVFATSPLTTHHQGIRTKVDWLRIRIICQERNDMSIHGRAVS